MHSSESDLSIRLWYIRSSTLMMLCNRKSKNLFPVHEFGCMPTSSYQRLYSKGNDCLHSSLWRSYISVFLQRNILIYGLTMFRWYFRIQGSSTISVLLDISPNMALLPCTSSWRHTIVILNYVNRQNTIRCKATNFFTSLYRLRIFLGRHTPQSLFHFHGIK
jgi:hypothetical protein